MAEPSYDEFSSRLFGSEAPEALGCFSSERRVEGVPPGGGEHDGDDDRADGTRELTAAMPVALIHFPDEQTELLVDELGAFLSDLHALQDFIQVDGSISRDGDAAFMNLTFVDEGPGYAVAYAAALPVDDGAVLAFVGYQVSFTDLAAPSPQAAEAKRRILSAAGRDAWPAGGEDRSWPLDAAMY